MSETMHNTDDEHDRVRGGHRRPMLCGQEVPVAGHVCAFFRTEEEKYAILAPFFDETIRAGDQIINVVDEAAPERHITRLQEAGVPVSQALSQGTLRVSTCEETYTRNGRLDLEGVIDMLRKALEAASREGRCIRTCGEMTWVARSPWAANAAMEYEARVNGLLATTPCTLLCVYDLTQMPGGLVSDILATHPFAIVNGRLRANPFAVPAGEYLQMLREQRERNNTSIQ